MQKLFIIAAILAFTSLGFAASFDCTKASNLVENAICSDSQLSDLDELLNRSYKQALANALNVNALKSEQRAWLKNVRNKCQDSLCLRRVYKERISVIDDSDTLSNDNLNERSMIGTYDYMEPGFSGTMEVSEISECALFPRELGCLSSLLLTAKIYTIHNNSSHDCDIDVIENKAARITSATKTEVSFIAKDKSDDINFTVMFNRKGADIESGNTFNGCGMQGSIMGHWQRKIGKD